LIETESPPGLDINEVELLLEDARGAGDLGRRIERISGRFLGRPYFENPLVGGPQSPEKLTVSLAGFDCVTYIETAFALACSRSADEFINEMREMRYAGGEIDWYHRNHYMLDWARNNEARGLIKDITGGPESVERTRTLSLIKSLPAKTVSFRCFPKRALNKVGGRIETGDAALFVSTRKALDVFHTGIVIRNADEISLRHATRTAGRVIEEKLAGFMSAHRMSGFILLRPLCKD
jgi:hypothetical protein